MDAQLLHVQDLWKQVYSDDRMLQEFLLYLQDIKQTHFSQEGSNDAFWYKDAIVYSLYVDLFNKNFAGLSERLNYLNDLGADCLWLLPVLESPMKDAGFDIADYTRIRADLLALPAAADDQQRETVFLNFMEKAKRFGIRVIFDIALNHCSVEHPWFKEACSDRHSPKRDYFIWSDTDNAFAGARIIFKGLCDSNWEWDDRAGQYYFHRFFEIQPDLNYKNPSVFIEMSKILINWKLKGIDGFRADAVPYLWKEEGTNCENHPKTHILLKLFRAVLDYLEEGILLLAEACQPPKDVVEYFGDGDECHAAYHFPVMPRIYMAMAEQNKTSLERILQAENTPAEIPDLCQWFMFLRCHDELTLEMVSEHERSVIYNYYVADASWDFRQGEGISARLASVFKQDFQKISLAYSIMFTLLGTPIIFYGDELAKLNDEAYYREQFTQTAYADSRYLVRGRIDWLQADRDLADTSSLPSKVYTCLQTMIAARSRTKVFSRGRLEFLRVNSTAAENDTRILAYKRVYGRDVVLVFQNLSAETIEIFMHIDASHDMLHQPIEKKGDSIVLRPFGFYWIAS